MKERTRKKKGEKNKERQKGFSFKFSFRYFTLIPGLCGLLFLSIKEEKRKQKEEV